MFATCAKCFTKFDWNSVACFTKNVRKMTFSICRRSSNSTRLIPRLVTCCAPALACTRTWPWSLGADAPCIFQTRRHTLSSQHLHAEPHCGLAASSRAASVCSMFGRVGGWGGVGASVGSGSKLLEDVCRAESGSCLAVSALRRSLAVYTDPANTPPAPLLGPMPYLGRGLHIQEHT